MPLPSVTGVECSPLPNDLSQVLGLDSSPGTLPSSGNPPLAHCRVRRGTGRHALRRTRRGEVVKGASWRGHGLAAHPEVPLDARSAWLRVVIARSPRAAGEGHSLPRGLPRGGNRLICEVRLPRTLLLRCASRSVVRGLAMTDRSGRSRPRGKRRAGAQWPLPSAGPGFAPSGRPGRKSPPSTLFRAPALGAL